MLKLPKVLFIIGQTASGKTALSLDLAKKFNGAIINADSRQVYKKMNIVTAKPPRDLKSPKSEYLVEGIKHYLIDICDPGQPFTLADFKKQAKESIKIILENGQLPIVVGGTGLYIWSLVDNLDIPAVAPNKKLRDSLEEKSLADLVKLLKNVDLQTAEKIDLKNKRRVLRALEVVLSSGESFAKQATKSELIYNSLQIGLHWKREEIFKRVEDRIDEQMKVGAVEETKELLKNYPSNLPSLSSVGYKQIGTFLRGECALEEAILQFKRDTRHYAKRQETWFKRDARIKWIEKNDIQAAEKLVKDFLIVQ
ncbi:MAG: tRNA (adenosine(37)-N6)-dimethylallyltransferase MiaA [Candidatus Magasanikbacteria bacterium]|nr:tRNA (adenosine(37)-N6)-dimethylallyltransferase MiaA [Candidatus Magasanikbacteria bacterium]